MYTTTEFSRDPFNGTVTYMHFDPSNGNIQFETIQEVTPLVEQTKAQCNSVDERARYGNGIVHVESVPSAKYWELKRLGIWDDPEAHRRWINEHPVYKARPGTV